MGGILRSEPERFPFSAAEALQCQIHALYWRNWKHFAYLICVSPQSCGWPALRKIPQDHCLISWSTGQHVSEEKKSGVCMNVQKCWNSFWLLKDKHGHNTNRISLFQDKSNTASVCPSTGSAAAAAPFKQTHVKNKTIYQTRYLMCWCHVNVCLTKYVLNSRDKIAPFCFSFSF